jgi:hypothetical protein
MDLVELSKGKFILKLEVLFIENVQIFRDAAVTHLVKG